MMYRTAASQKLNNIAYALIIGGALGNLFDRARHGFVVDFIDFYIGGWHFATFNIADCGICVGAALIVLEGFYPFRQTGEAKGQGMTDSVQRDSAVLLHFTLKLEDGSTAESTRANGKPALFRLGDGSLSDALETALLGLRVGEKKRLRWSRKRRSAASAPI